MAGHKSQAGFTLVEILITLAIFGVLCAMTVINLGAPQTAASLNGTVDELVADLKAQQLLAMTGDSGSLSDQQPQGVLIAADHYTLFAGAAFDGGDGNNYTLTPGEGISFSTDFDDSQVLFNKGSGELSGGGTITVGRDGESKTITINRLGTVTVQ